MKAIHFGFAAVLALFATAADAATTITIDNVRQRWPWNNNVDITYTIAGDDPTVDNVCRVVISTIVDGVTYTAYNGAVNVNVLPGTYTVTWTGAPAGVKQSDCKMSARLYTIAVPTGDDYMIDRKSVV